MNADNDSLFGWDYPHFLLELGRAIEMGKEAEEYYLEGRKGSGEDNLLVVEKYIKISQITY